MSVKFKPFLKKAGKSTSLNESFEKVYKVLVEEYQLCLKSFAGGGKAAAIRNVRDSLINLKEILLQLRISPFDLQQIHENSLGEIAPVQGLKAVADEILFHAVGTLYEIYREYILQQRGRTSS